MKLWLEEEDSLAEQIDARITESLPDFPEDEPDDTSKYAAEIARAVITEKTREGHLRYLYIF